MSFLSRALRFLFWVLVLSWTAKLLRDLVAWMMRGGSTPSPQQGSQSAGSRQASGLSRRLVRDPVCGVHVAEVLAIPLREGTTTLHFCSLACRDTYVRTSGGKAKMVANG
jgi:YHS domain-containing protein